MIQQVTSKTSLNIGADRLVIRYYEVLPYLPVWEAMKAYVAKKHHQRDELWILQHEPTYTRGVRCKEQPLEQGKSVPVVSVDRGGLMTYHGPGQLILYCLIDLKRKRLNIKQIVYQLEQAVINLLTSYRLQANRIEGAPGVYFGEKKIASVGLRIRNNQTYHGLSVNFEMDMTPFDWIDPCGFKTLQVVQLKDLVVSFSWQESQTRLINEFVNVFDYTDVEHVA